MTIAIPITPQLVISLILGVPLLFLTIKGTYDMVRNRSDENPDTFSSWVGACVILLTVFALGVCFIAQISAMFMGYWFFWEIPQ